MLNWFYFKTLEISSLNLVSQAGNLILFTSSKELYSFILKNSSWDKRVKFKKHKALDSFNCSKSNNISLFYQKWWNKSGIYKITFLGFRIFNYYGSSSNLGQRIKYHFYNGKHQKTYLGLFIEFFGIDKFSFTILETCSKSELKVREDWYLDKFKPLLNMLIASYTPNETYKVSELTKLKISKSLLNKEPMSVETKKKMSLSKTGELNYWFGKTLHKNILDAAAELKGTQVYVYKQDSFELINNKPFRSIRDAVKHLPISASTLTKKLDSGLPFKSFYYFSKAQMSKP